MAASHRCAVAGRRGVLAIALYTVAGTILHAQNQPLPRLQLGPTASLTLGPQTGEFSVYNGSPGCGLFSGGTITAPWFGAVAQMPTLFNERFGLAARLGWSPLLSSYTAAPEEAQRIIDPVSFQLVDVEREFRLDATQQTISLDLLAHYTPFGRWAIGIGPSLGVRVASSFRQTDNIISQDRTFSDGERTHTMEEGLVFKSNPFTLGAAFTASVAIPLQPRVTIVPEISMRGTILSSVDASGLDLPWRNISAGAGFSVLFDLLGPEQPPPPDTPIVAAIDTTPPPPPPRLQAAITVQGIDENNRVVPEATIIVREVVYQQNIPLLPALYFDQGSDSIPARYNRLSREETGAFSYLNVAELGALDLSHSLLDLVGFRMRQERAARLTLHGATSSDEPAALAASRTARIRDYLVDVWGIPRSRIDVRSGGGPLPLSDDATADGREENRRVLFTSNSPNLLAPLSTERTVRDFNPPMIDLDPAIVAEAGIRRWSVVLRQGNDTLAHVIPEESAMASQTSLSWRLLDERIDSSLSLLVAELSVEDSAAQRAVARDTIGLRMQHESTVVGSNRTRNGERERISAELVAFGYRSTAGDKAHDLLLEELAEQLRPGATLQITGYTDRIGDDRYNLELSQGRAHYVAERIRGLAAKNGVRDLQIVERGAGVSTGRFPNDLPEGRVLSRGVTIVAEQTADPDGRP